MFKDDSFGLVTIIACIVPGTVALSAIGYFYPPLRRLLNNAINLEAGIGPASLVVLAALACRMIVSVIRGSTIDHTFRIDLRKWFPRLHLQYESLARIEPLLGDAITKVPFKTIDEVRRRFHAPFQFYGNMEIALLGLGLVMVIDSWPMDEKYILAIGLGYVFLCSALYASARGSYHRAVWVLDKLVVCSEK